MEGRKKLAKDWFWNLRNNIREEFLNIEKEYNPDFKGNFKLETWKRISPGLESGAGTEGGGGEISVLYGEVFEKIGVNISTVYGSFRPEFAAEIKGAKDNNNAFWASGISLVAHMNSPLVPAVHMNTRMIITKDCWFGGGTDLTPTYYNEADKTFFHAELKKICDCYNPDYYNKFSKWADEYFYIKHRKEARGIGGIFYDYLESPSEAEFQQNFNFTKAVGEAFLKIFSAIVRKNMFKNYKPEQKEFQLYKRGRYVEFNLIYDRGTRFGLMTDGNPEAILMSLPPVAKWGIP